jgi:hypothetical protein
MRDVAGVALWRDIVGFIPVYTCFLMFGFWLGAYHLSWDLLKNLQLPGIGMAWWWLIPVIAAANYLEDACHLTYLRLHAKSAQATWALTVNIGSYFAGLCCRHAGVSGPPLTTSAPSRAT